MPDLTALAWALLAFGAVTVGISKTALPGSSTLAVAIFAAVLPPKQSTGTLLLLLITADLFAVAAYTRHTDWRALLRLAPAVVAGLLVGVVFLAVADDQWVKRFIAVILLAVIAITLLRRRFAKAVVEEGRAHPAAAITYGVLGGFSTMVANAAGPVMSMYFLASRFSVMQFLGTAAWFYALINLTKLPFSIGLGLITAPGLLTDVVLVPAVVLGAIVGRRLAPRMDQRMFERLVIVLTVIGAVYLLF